MSEPTVPPMHEHSWSIGIHHLGGPYVVVRCQKPGCAAWLTCTEAEALLNEPRQLNAPVEFLGKPIAYWVGLDNLAKERGLDRVLDRFVILITQLRQLADATENLIGVHPQPLAYRLEALETAVGEFIGVYDAVPRELKEQVPFPIALDYGRLRRTYYSNKFEMTPPVETEP